MSYVVLYQHHYCDKVLCRSTYEAAAHGGEYVKVIVVKVMSGRTMSGATTLRCSRARTSPVANDASSEGGGGKGDLEDVDILQDEDKTSILCSAVASDQDSEKFKRKLLPR